MKMWAMISTHLSIWFLLQLVFRYAHQSLYWIDVKVLEKCYRAGETMHFRSGGR